MKRVFDRPDMLLYRKLTAEVYCSQRYKVFDFKLLPTTYWSAFTPRVYTMSRPFFSPGIALVANSLVKALVPSITTYGALSLLPLSKVFLWSAAACSFPVLSCIKSCWTAYTQRREREAMGALVIPAWKGSWPGNLDLLLQVIDQIKSDYIGRSRHFVSLFYP